MSSIVAGTLCGAAPPHFWGAGALSPWRMGGTNGDGELRCAPASYTDTDEHKIQHCFCYTSTVLTSTLAFQKEQKLKCECQVSMFRAMSHACVCPILH